MLVHCRLTRFSKKKKGTIAYAQCQGVYNAEHKMLNTEPCSTHTNLNLPPLSRKAAYSQTNVYFKLLFQLIHVIHSTITLVNWEDLSQQNC